MSRIYQRLQRATSIPCLVEQRHTPHFPLRICGCRQRIGAFDQTTVLPKKRHLPHSVGELAVPLPLVVDKARELFPNLGVDGQLGVRG